MAFSLSEAESVNSMGSHLVPVVDVLGLKNTD